MCFIDIEIVSEKKFQMHLKEGISYHAISESFVTKFCNISVRTSDYNNFKCSDLLSFLSSSILFVII